MTIGTEERCGRHFVEVRAFRDLPVQDATEPAWQRSWQFAKDEDRQSLRGQKYVYALVWSKSSRPTLHAEYFADEDGVLWKTDGARRLSLEPKNCPKGKKIGHHDDFTVFKNGERCWWFFGVTRTRLSRSALRALLRLKCVRSNSYAEGLSGTCRFVLYDLKDTFIYVPSNEGDYGIPVVDLVSVAEYLWLEYHHQEKAYDDYLNIAAAKTGEKRNEIKHRLLTYTLATAIIEMVRKSLRLLRQLKEGKASAAWEFLFQFNKDVSERTSARDTAALRLCDLLHSPQFDFLYGLHKLSGAEGVAKWREGTGRALQRLSNSQPGQRLLEDPPRFIKDFLASYSDPLEKEFTSRQSALVARRSITGLAYYVTSLAPQLLLQPLRQRAAFSRVRVEKVFEKLNRDLDAGVFRIEKLTDEITKAKRTQKFYEGIDELERAQFALRVDERAAARFDSAFKRHLGVTAVEALKTAADNVYYVWTLWEYSDKSELKSYEKVKGLGALNNLLKNLAWGRMLKSAHPAMLFWGKGGKVVAPWATVGLEGVAGYLEGRALIHDSGQVAAGASAVAYGFASAVYGLGGLGLVSPPLAMVAAGVMLLTSVLTVALQRSEIELFVAHSMFGKDHGESFLNKVSAKWAYGRFSDWADGAFGLERQVKTLYSVLALFTVKSDGMGGVYVDLPAAGYDDKVHVEIEREGVKLGAFQIVFAYGEYEVQYQPQQGYKFVSWVKLLGGKIKGLFLALKPEDPRWLLGPPLRYKVVLSKAATSIPGGVVRVPVDDSPGTLGTLGRDRLPWVGLPLTEARSKDS